MVTIDDLGVSALLLVRNSVDHDARVLRAARVAGRELDGTPLVVGVATASGGAGATIMEGIGVVRFETRPPALARMQRLGRPSSIERVRKRVGKHPDSDRGAAPISGGMASSPRLTPTARARRILSGLSFALQALL